MEPLLSTSRSVSPDQPVLSADLSLDESRLPAPPYRLSVDTALPYRTGRRAGTCRLRLFVPASGLSAADEPAVVLATELPENQRLSVTNGIEVIAAEVCRSYNLNPRQTVLIEHYDDRANGYAARLPGRVHGETFSCVTSGELRDTAEGVRPRRPQWRRLSKSEVEAFLGAPLP